MAKPTTIRLEDQLTADLDTLVALTERPRNWHIEQAVRRYLAEERQFLEAVEEGIAAARAGKVIPHSAVVAELDAIIAAARAERQ
jgi:predicted transcriptional regulator